MTLSLFLTETLGITAGGIIVPGYIALELGRNPINIIITFLISILTILILNILSNWVLIYGKRRIVLCLLFGFLFGILKGILLLVIFLWFFDSYISNNLYTILTEESKIISLLHPMKDCINQAITIPL